MLRATLTALVLAVAFAGCANPELTPTSVADPHAKDGPARPVIPDNFQWSGRYLVPDLDVDVPFTWNGRGGNMQMVAGGEDEEIWFTNLIVDGQLYTLTEKWPDIDKNDCSHVGPYTLKELNKGFSGAAFAGRETLHDRGDHEVNHFRSVGVVELPPAVTKKLEKESGGIPIRLPLMAGDIYVDSDNPEHLRQLLHFGIQNLYDPNLDEWIVIEKHSDAPGKVELPEKCSVGSS